MSIQLTANEAAVLLTFNTYGDAECTKSDLGVSWTGVDEIAKDTGKSLASVKGILGSLIKKGLVQSDEADAFSGKPIAQCLTDDGVDALFALRAEEAPVVGETQVAETLAFIEAQTEEADLDEEADEGPATFIPAAPVFENGLEMDPAEVEAFEAPVADAPKPAKAKAAPRSKLVLVGLDGKPVESRRAPTPDTLALVLTLVEAFGGGKPFTNEAAAAIGFDEEALKRVFKRVKSWFGRDKVAHGKDGWVLSLRLQAGPDREEGVREEAPAEAAA